MDSLKLKILWSPVGTAIEDSLGAGSERYTDDTALMIGLAVKLWQAKIGRIADK
jgi:hypothetical protein